MKYLTTIIIASIFMFIAWVWIISPLVQDVTNTVNTRIDKFNTITDQLK